MYEINEGISNVISLAKANFVESVDVVVAIDKKMAKQGVRGVIDLPHAVKGDMKICVFIKDELAEEVMQAGAELAGGEDLIQKIIDNPNIGYDWFVSTPDFMPKVAKLSKILGPKGLMPNPKFGTVTPSVIDVINKLKKGRVKFKSDSHGFIHLKVGNVNFTIGEIEDNIRECLSVIKTFSNADGKPLTIQFNSIEYDDG